ncbi:MAG: hypothetical protein CL840_02255 [Crocinitomicaceae bacterium]|nr:hypothetical protein [Crocinitomicaceae bacterium]|tara:strand:+ start:1914 stop:4529 length:2616 start_codon:yes stop_codon:yes gene_type:complete
MRKSLLIIIAISCSTFLYSQAWKSELPNKSELTLQDYQKAFDTYFEEHPEAIGQKGNGYKQFKRWEWFWSPRVTPNGEFPSNRATWDNWANYVEEHGSYGTRGTMAKTWTSLGPNKIEEPDSGQGVGRINCIAFHPTNANTFWIGTPAGGLWKTTDNGKTWSTNTDNLPVLGVSDIAIHPTTPTTMWIATGDGDGAISLGTFGAPGRGDTKSVGILKSTNGGATWTPSYSAKVTDSLLIRRLIIDKKNPDYLYAATSKGILATSNGGTSWQIVQSGYFMDIEINPSSADTLYASTFEEEYGGAAIYVTGDGGSNWNMVFMDTNVARYNIEVTPKEPDYVYILGTERWSEVFYDLNVSTDRGANWSNEANKTNDGNLLGWEIARSDNEGQGTYDLAFAVSPLDEEEVYVGGVITWMTTDAAQTWKVANFWSAKDENEVKHSFPVVHADKHFLTYHPLRNNELYECNDGGVWRTSDKGKTWENLSNGMAISQIYAIGLSQKDKDIFVMGLQDNGSKGHDDGDWLDVSGGDGMDCAYDDKNEYVYTSYVNGEIFRTDSDTQITISNNLPGGTKGAWLTPFELDAVNESIIIAGYDEVFKSSNSGDTWTQLGTLGATDLIKYLSVSDLNPDIIYVANDQEIAMTNNGGTSWSDISTGLPLSKVNISSVFADPTDKNYVIVTLSGYEASEKIYVSSDQGKTWANYTYSGLPNVPANCFVMDAKSGDNYIGTDVGVFLIDSATNTWSRFGDKLPNVPVVDMKIHVATSKLRIGTFGRGMWESELNTVSNPNVSVKELTSGNGIEVYPNPANDKISVRLESFEAGQQVDIYNYLGEKVKSVTITSNETEVSISGLSSGIYYVGQLGYSFQDFTRFVRQ